MSWLSSRGNEKNEVRCETKGYGLKSLFITQTCKRAFSIKNFEGTYFYGRERKSFPSCNFSCFFGRNESSEVILVSNLRHIIKKFLALSDIRLIVSVGNGGARHCGRHCHAIDKQTEQNPDRLELLNWNRVDF